MLPRIHGLLLFLILPLSALAQPQPTVIHLWENGAPGFETRKDEPEQAADYWVRNINNPSITVFAPPKDKANGCAVIVAPGGGYRLLVYNSEGKQAAEFLNSIGVTAFVLKYRLPKAEGSPYTVEDVHQDALRAIRLVRSRADEFNIDPNRIGMIGFSAGGAAAMMAAFNPSDGDPKAADPIDRANGRLNFLMLVYPGGDLYPDGRLPATLAPDTPPAFLICANDDEYGCDAYTVELLVKYRAAKVPVEAFFLAQGKHAFNMGDHSSFAAIKHWPQRLEDWLGDSGFLTPAIAKNSSGSAPRSKP